MVARAIHGMIALGGCSEEVSLVSPTRDSTLADPQQLIADLRRELDECRAERDNAQRKLEERTAEHDEAPASGIAARSSAACRPSATE
jgi:hypothetical protein